jgi:hypothetical protein
MNEKMSVVLICRHNDLAWNLRKFLQNQLREVNFDSDLRQVCSLLLFSPFNINYLSNLCQPPFSSLISNSSELLTFQLEPFSGSPWSHTDLIRLRQGGVGAQVKTCF